MLSKFIFVSSRHATVSLLRPPLQQRGLTLLSARTAAAQHKQQSFAAQKSTNTTLLHKRGFAARHGKPAADEDTDDQHADDQRAEEQREYGRKGHAAAMQNMVDSGEAATLEEAASLHGVRGHTAAMQHIVDSGEAATLEEAARRHGARGHAAAVQKLVDSGKAATLEEAVRMHGGRAHAAAMQNMVESVEVATLEEAASLLGVRGHAAAVQKLVDSGEAATLEEAASLHGVRGSAAAAANNPFGETGHGMNAGVAAALKEGKYTRYPGVCFYKPSRRWRLAFHIGGKKRHLGYFATEEEAAQFHDDYVREHGLRRPLHFPRDGELSSGIYRDNHDRRLGIIPLLPQSLGKPAFK